jgi:hypothetical protein
MKNLIFTVLRNNVTTLKYVWRSYMLYYYYTIQRFILRILKYFTFCLNKQCVFLSTLVLPIEEKLTIAYEFKILKAFKLYQQISYVFNVFLRTSKNSNCVVWLLSSPQAMHCTTTTILTLKLNMTSKPTAWGFKFPISIWQILNVPL